MNEEAVLIGDPRVTGIPVHDNGEDLVDARQIDELLVGGERADQNGAHTRLREGVAARLIQAQRQLPGGFHFELVEAYRPLSLQRLYFNRYARHLWTQNPALQPGEVEELASRYVAPPHAAPHVTGGAVDLTLLDSEGRRVHMGTAINATPEESAGACYLRAGNISDDARRLRGILSKVLTDQGLVNYPTEWWHWSYGERYWAFATGAEVAIYGPTPGAPTD